MTDKAGKKIDMICLGHVADAHGIHGEVLIKAYTDDWEDIGGYGPLFSEDGSQEFILKDIRVIKKGVVAKVKGVRYRDQAEALKGQALYISRDKLPEDDEDDSWYHVDLIGLKAIGSDGADYGEILAIPNFGAGDLLEIKLLETGKTELIPFTMACVPEVNVREGYVKVCPMEEFEVEDEEEES